MNFLRRLFSPNTVHRKTYANYLCNRDHKMIPWSKTLTLQEPLLCVERDLALDCQLLSLNTVNFFMRFIYETYCNYRFEPYTSHVDLLHTVVGVVFTFGRSRRTCVGKVPNILMRLQCEGREGTFCGFTPRLFNQLVSFDDRGTRKAGIYNSTDIRFMNKEKRW